MSKPVLQNEQDEEDLEENSFQQIRPEIHETMMEVARAVSKRATCPRASMGCVITDQKGFILSTGYNGAPRGMHHCTEVGCLMEGYHCIRTAHAEQNAIITAGRNGVSLERSIAYITARPCIRCLMMLIQAGVKEIYYGENYASDDLMTAKELAHEARIILRPYSWLEQGFNPAVSIHG